MSDGNSRFGLTPRSRWREACFPRLSRTEPEYQQSPHLLTGSQEFKQRRRIQDKERGEEVWYDIHAFSRPRPLLARLGYPLARVLQRRFAEDSKRAMVRAVEPTG